MIALVLAAALAGKPVLVEASPLILTPPPCREKMEVARDPLRLAPRKLGDLPQATAEYAVMRKIEGCTVPAPMSLRGVGPKP